MSSMGGGGGGGWIFSGIAQYSTEFKRLSDKTILNEILCLATSKMQCDDHFTVFKNN